MYMCMHTSMNSYNNIVEKGEPTNTRIIDSALDIFTELPNAVQHAVQEGVDCIVVDNFLSNEECDALISACETVGYTFWKQKSHDTAEATDRRTEATNPVRVVDTIEANFDKLSRKLFERITAVVNVQPMCFSPDMTNAEDLYQRDLDGEWVPCAVSRNLLFGRYQVGGHFMPHVDGSTLVDLNTRSLYTLLIYLNDCPAGGETRIFSGDQCSVMYLDPTTGKYRGCDDRIIGALIPRKGRAAFFIMICCTKHNQSNVESSTSAERIYFFDVTRRFSQKQMIPRPLRCTRKPADLSVAATLWRHANFFNKFDDSHAVLRRCTNLTDFNDIFSRFTYAKRRSDVTQTSIRIDALLRQKMADHLNRVSVSSRMNR